jgi:hypothetical protein
MDNFDDFDTEIQSDELIPSYYEEDDDRGLTADERDERGLQSIWRDECFNESTDDDEDELCAVFGADDEDNFLGSEYGDADGDFEDGGDDDW